MICKGTVLCLRIKNANKASVDVENETEQLR